MNDQLRPLRRYRGLASKKLIIMYVAMSTYVLLGAGLSSRSMSL